MCRCGLLGRHFCGLWWSLQAAIQSVGAYRSCVVSKVLNITLSLFDSLGFAYWTSLLLSLPADQQWKCYLVGSCWLVVGI